MGFEAEGVEIRAFRGSRRSAVYREHVVADTAFAGMLAAARENGLPLLGSLPGRGSRRLEPREAWQLAREADRLGGELRSAALARHLEAIAGLARWCARARGRSWMTIAGR